jgi:PIN domain nuclease of toxin-antitoxin system
VTCVVDTHALVWYFAGSRLLGKKAHAELRNPASRIVVPTIVLAELKYLHHRNRIDVPFDAVRRVLGDDPRCVLHPLDEDVLDLLPLKLDIHDGIICATALAIERATGQTVKVITRDQEVVESALVDVLW